MSEKQVPDAAIQGLLSQLDASKTMFNESVNTIFQLRTQCIQLDKINKDLQKEINQLKENLAAKDAEIARLSNPQSADVAPDVAA